MRFSDLPIQRKLLWGVLLSVAVAAAVLGGAIVVYETSRFQPMFVKDARADAKMMAEVLIPALEFSDDKTAVKQLSSLERRQEVVASVIYLRAGSLFVSRARNDEHRFPPMMPDNTLNFTINDRVVTLYEVIPGPEGNLGWVGLRFQLPNLGQRMVGYGLFIIASGVSLAVLAGLFSYVVHRAVSGPVESLMKATQEVSETKDYTLRVPVKGRDEFGRLAGAFNEMLAAIGMRDEERLRHEERLARYNSGLVELAQAEAVSSGNSAEQLELVLAILSRVHRVSRVSMWLFDKEMQAMRCIAGYDARTKRHFSGATLAVSFAPVYFENITLGSVLAVENTATDPHVAELYADYLQPEGITSMLDLPVSRHGRLAGVLCHEHTGAPRHWETQEINFATAVSNRVVLLLESDELDSARRALQESESRYREMVEAAPDAIFTLDRDGRIREPNGAMSRLTAWPEDRWNGLALVDAVLVEDRLLALTACAEVATTGASKVVNLRFLRKDGLALALECYLVPRYLAAGPGDVLCVGRDQTERLAALAAQALLQDQLRISQKMEAVGTLAGGIAHDFNNILTALMGNLELIDYELRDDHQARIYLGNTLKATERARDLVRQILTFSRQQESKRRPVKLAEIVSEAMRLLRATLPTSIEIVNRFDLEAPEILADESQIHQVIMNLATNSFHAMETTGGQLTFELARGAVDEAKRVRHPQLREGEYVVLTVSDTGCGMDEATQRRLFEPFFTTKPQGRGTGLGMAVVHGILQSHEAMVAIQSALWKGTTIRLYFPLWNKALPVTPRTASPFPPAKAKSTARVMVVDDETLVAQVAEMVLRRSGMVVSSFNDSLAALAAFKAQPDAYDLVLTDLTMPQMGGLDLARKIRELRPRLPVVLMTGYGGDHNAAVFDEAGVHGPLQKPFTAKALGDMVAEVLVKGAASPVAI